MSTNPNNLLWEQAKTAQEILDQGLCALLQPYEVQALELVAI
jgi:hypothetical protein